MIIVLFTETDFVVDSGIIIKNAPHVTKKRKMNGAIYMLYLKC